MDLKRIKDRHLGRSTRRRIYEGKLQSYLNSGMDVFDLCRELGLTKDDAILILEAQEIAKDNAIREFLMKDKYIFQN